MIYATYFDDKNFAGKKGKIRPALCSWFIICFVLVGRWQLSRMSDFVLPALFLTRVDHMSLPLEKYRSKILFHKLEVRRYIYTVEGSERKTRQLLRRCCEIAKTMTHAVGCTGRVNYVKN